jgi:hypothetical protein
MSEKEIKRGKEQKKKEFPNGIPPQGVDALRFSLLQYMRKSKDTETGEV